MLDLPDSTPSVPSVPPLGSVVAAMLGKPDEPLSNPASFPWEHHHAFRFSFLLNFTQPGDREAFECLGNLLYNMALECSDKWPDWPESSTRAEMRAVALDLRHAAGFLAATGAERIHSSLDDEDERLCYMASTWAHMVEKIARAIESVLPHVRGEKAS